MVAAGAPVRDASCTLSEWLEEWRGTFLRASDRAESTKVLYTGLTRHHVEPVIGHLKLHQIRPTDVTRALLAMQEAGKAASARRNGYAALRSCLDGAVANGLLAANPVLRVKRPRAEHHEASSLDPTDARRLLDGAADLRYGVAGVHRGPGVVLQDGSGWDPAGLTHTACYLAHCVQSRMWVSRGTEGRGCASSRGQSSDAVQRAGFEHRFVYRLCMTEQERAGQKRLVVWLGYLLVSVLVVLASALRLTNKPSGLLLVANLVILAVGVVGVLLFAPLSIRAWRHTSGRSGD